MRIDQEHNRNEYYRKIHFAVRCFIRDEEDSRRIAERIIAELSATETNGRIPERDESWLAAYVREVCLTCIENRIREPEFHASGYLA